MGWGAGTALVVFLPLVQAGSLSAWVLAVLCVSACQTQVTARNHQEGTKGIFLEFLLFFFFYSSFRS